jgi:hypothetical protein
MEPNNVQNHGIQVEECFAVVFPKFVCEDFREVLLHVALICVLYTSRAV